ncbi:hypothetical protein [Synechococcus sp. BL107]|uniref:hypothetical protein n=1 Tax=Synechococcus sp. BL107 TaxID=313625 RepID=UPI0012EA390D|nr:hypothetical protein [Synechococcus sp. BL107]|tara:strand:- start:1169 stop:1723 length:555 start_codon:yes stop_codon:yes gene_type:complete
MFNIFNTIRLGANSYSLSVFLSLGLTIQFYVPTFAQAGIQDTTTFNATVPFTCSFSGGSDLVSMDYTRNGSTGIMAGTSESLLISSNQVPRVNVTLNTLLAPSGIGFRGIWIRSDNTNRIMKNKTSSSYSNSPISTILQPSNFRSHDYSSGLPYGIKLTVSANLSNSFPNDEYRFQVVLTCLEP